MGEQTIVHEARLHWILFFWPALLFFSMLFVAADYEAVRVPSLIVAGIAVLWGSLMVLTYLFSSLVIKKKQVILRTGILIRQTIDIPLSKIESIDIRQTILGSILRYGSLVITGTGGTRQVIHYVDKPLTCRRYIEQLLHE